MFRTLACPSCGAPLPPNAKRVVVSCRFCQATVSWEQPLVRAADYRKALAALDTAVANERRVVVADVPYRVLAHLGRGESCDVYLAERARRLTERVVLKLLRAEDEADLLALEWEACARLARSHERGAEHFTKLVPIPVAYGRNEDRSASVYRFSSGFVHTLDDVLAAHPYGLDPRHVVWIWKRLLELIDFAHRSGLVHGAILPAHVLVHARDHGVKLVGWACAGAPGEPLRIVRVGQLTQPSVRQTLLRLRDRKRAELEGTDAQELGVFDDPSLVDRWLEAARSVLARVTVVNDRELEAQIARAGRVVCEGAQGVLLDEWRGFHPHTTWSTCTTEPARALLAPSFDASEIMSLGVLRTYATRHGAGPFPTESAKLTSRLPDAHNVDGPWQGPLRVGAIDAVLARYALEVSGGVDALAIPHVDAIPKLDPPSICVGYRVDGAIDRLQPSASVDLAHQERLTSLLFRASPILEHHEDEAFVSALEAALDREVAFTSHGPTAAHVRSAVRQHRERGVLGAE